MTDKWVQLKSRNGVDNLFPKSKMDLLWTNSSPSSSFSPQTIEVDLSDYSAVGIIFRSTTTDASYTEVKVFPKITLSIWTNYLAGSFRNVTAVSDSGVTFGSGSQPGSTKNDYGIPYQIYGIN